LRELAKGIGEDYSLGGFSDPLQIVHEYAFGEAAAFNKPEWETPYYTDRAMTAQLLRKKFA